MPGLFSLMQRFSEPYGCGRIELDSRARRRERNPVVDRPSRIAASQGLVEARQDRVGGSTDLIDFGCDRKECFGNVPIGWVVTPRCLHQVEGLVWITV